VELTTSIISVGQQRSAESILGRVYTPGPPQNPLRLALGPVDQSDENFSFLRNPADRTDFWDPLKYIPLDSSGKYYLTFWLEERSEYEWFQNEMWG
jgi:hypothetical protein